MDLRRRKFLAQFCQGTSAGLFLPFLNQFESLKAVRGPAADGLRAAEYHLHPRYRERLPIEPVLAKVDPALDRFPIERYHDKIAAELRKLSDGLRSGSRETIQGLLSPEFAGVSLHPAETKLIRDSSAIKLWRKTSGTAPAGREVFVESWRAEFEKFSKIETADFQVTRAEETRENSAVLTRVLFEIAGMAEAGHREQRIGHWDIGWERSEAGDWRAKSWKPLDEEVSQASGLIFSDVSKAVLGANECYAEQLVHGVDYWRTVLDGACGIDIYGHNGVSVGDIDNDGLDDLYICQSAGLPNRLFRNRGDGTFEDITESSGLGILENTACAIFADFRNQGQQDAIIVKADGPVFFANQGGGKFRRTAEAFHFAKLPQGTFTGAAAADYDRDGWLDIYFCLYTYYQGTDQYKYPLPYYDAENGPPNFLMKNQRDGTFRDVTEESGLNRNNTRYSFCCGWNDFDGDGWPDLYVVNDFGRKNLYRNNQNGTFTDVAASAGVEDVGAGMGVCWADFNNDGREDLYVADMWTAAGERVSAQPAFQADTPEEVRALYRKHAMGNSLFRNEGSGRFQDETARAGVARGRWAWACDAWDFDHDGYSDIYVVNGMVSGPERDDLNSFFWRQVVANSPAAARPSHDYEQGWNAINELIRADGTWSGNERNVFFANNGDGTFTDISGAIGLDFLEDGRAFALADFDQDGRLEVLVKNRSGPQVRVVKNVMEGLPPSVAFRLRGTKSNRDAIGAKVTLSTEQGKQVRSVQAGSGFLCQHSKEVIFGLGESKGLVGATIQWPSGLVQEFSDIQPNHRVWVEEGAKPTRIEPFKQPSQGLTAEPVSEGREHLPINFGTWLLSPIAAPEFSLEDKRGTTQNLKGLRGKLVLLSFWSGQEPGWREHLKGCSQLQANGESRGIRVLAVEVEGEVEGEALEEFRFPIVRGSDEVCGVYNIFYRSLFDRHRDMEIPTSMLIDESGNVVKVYQGTIAAQEVAADLVKIPRTRAERMAKALLFKGVSDGQEFRRNYLSYGSQYFQRGYYGQAGAAFERALQDDAVSAEALYGLGSVYLKQGKNEEARENFERVVRLEATYPDTLPNAWNNLGLLSARGGDMQSAEKYFGEALKINPDHLVALVNLGNAYREEKRWGEARTVLERAVGLSPEDAEANYSLGMVYAQGGDNERAYQHLQQALKSRPGYPEALNNLAILYLRTGRRDQAVESLQQCMNTAPDFDQCYLNLARVYTIEGSSQKAREILLGLLKRHPENESAQKALAQLPQ